MISLWLMLGRCFGVQPVKLFKRAGEQANELDGWCLVEAVQACTRPSSQACRQQGCNAVTTSTHGCSSVGSPYWCHQQCCHRSVPSLVPGHQQAALATTLEDNVNAMTCPLGYENVSNAALRDVSAGTCHCTLPYALHKLTQFGVCIGCTGALAPAPSQAANSVAPNMQPAHTITH